MGRTLRLVWSISPGWALANGALAVVQGLLPLAAIWLMGSIVDAVNRGIGAADKGAAFGDVTILVLLAGGVAVATALARSLTTFVSEAQAQITTDYISDVIHAQSVAVDLEYYENPKYYDALHRSQQEAPTRPARIITDLTTVGQSLITLVAMIAVLLTLHWSIGLIVVAAAIPGALVRIRFSNKLFRWQRRRTTDERRAWYLHWLLTDGTRAKELRLYRLGELLRTWYRDVRRKLRRERLRITAARSAGDLGAAAGAAVAVFGTFAYIAWKTINGVLTVGDMVKYYMAFQQSLQSLQTALTGLASLYEDNLFLTYYYDFLALEPRVLPPEKATPVPHPMREGIAFSGVTFNYPDSERVAVADLDLLVRPGEIAALVGPNGSGKTTLVKLLCRLYDPQQGSITVDGVDLRDVDPVELRRGIGVIFQDFAQYQLSVRQNIWIGNVDLAEDDPRVVAAACDSGADEVIAGLRDGYDSKLGKWFADGEELSIGEWQKVALARAFVRDAEILILDEPTSALDPMAEYRVFEHIRGLAKGRAVILVSHRFSTVTSADRIHIMEHGRIVESGTHDELMRLGGRYAEMYEIQARAYRS